MIIILLAKILIIFRFSKSFSLFLILFTTKCLAHREKCRNFAAKKRLVFRLSNDNTHIVHHRRGIRAAHHGIRIRNIHHDSAAMDNAVVWRGHDAVGTARLGHVAHPGREIPTRDCLAPTAAYPRHIPRHELLCRGDAHVAQERCAEIYSRRHAHPLGCVFRVLRAPDTGEAYDSDASRAGSDVGNDGRIVRHARAARRAVFPRRGRVEGAIHCLGAMLFPARQLHDDALSCRSGIPHRRCGCGVVLCRAGSARGHMARFAGVQSSLYASAAQNRICIYRH